MVNLFFCSDPEGLAFCLLAATFRPTTHRIYSHFYLLWGSVQTGPLVKRYQGQFAPFNFFSHDTSLSKIRCFSLLFFALPSTSGQVLLFALEYSLTDSAKPL